MKSKLLIFLILVFMLVPNTSAQPPLNDELVIVEDEVIIEEDFEWSNYYSEHIVFPVRPRYEIPETDSNGRLSRFIQINTTSYSLLIMKCRWFNLSEPEYPFDSNGTVLTIYEIIISSSSSHWSLIRHNVSEGANSFLKEEVILPPDVMLNDVWELYSLNILIVNETLSLPILFYFEVQLTVTFKIVYELYFWQDPVNPYTSSTAQEELLYYVLLNPITIAILIDFIVGIAIYKDYNKRKEEFSSNAD